MLRSNFLLLLEELGRFRDRQPIEVRDETVASYSFRRCIALSPSHALRETAALECIRFGFYRFIAYSF